MSKIYLLYENAEWLSPLTESLVRRGVPHEAISLNGGSLDLANPPPPGVYYCRMSASAHTRGHAGAASYAAAMLAWLERHERRVINGSRALAMEISKVNQYMALKAAGIPAPYSRAASGRDGILAAAKAMAFPIIVKPNCGGKGLGIVKMDDIARLQAYVEGAEFDRGPDGIVILQTYLQPQDGAIVRSEFVGGEHLYSVKVRTGGEFELCPADACAIDDAPRFVILDGFRPRYLDRYRKLLSDNGIEVAGVEHLSSGDEEYTYDINVNTNYNTAAEERAGYTRTDASGVAAVTTFLHQELDRCYPGSIGPQQA